MGAQLPLTGIRVADFSWVGAGPFLTKPLADHGADVVKVESRTRVDPIRSMAPFRDAVTGTDRSGYFANRNTSKRSMCLDLKHPRGRELAMRLIEVSDVVVNNFSPGTMDRLGLGYDAARAVRPDVIYLEMPMLGTEGPHRDCRGYGLTIAAAGGLLGLTGYDDAPPVGTGTNYPDHVPNPLHGAVAVLAALRKRRRTGQGEYIELAQLGRRSTRSDRRSSPQPRAPPSVAQVTMTTWRHPTASTRAQGRTDGARSRSSTTNSGPLHVSFCTCRNRSGWRPPTAGGTHDHYSTG